MATSTQEQVRYAQQQVAVSQANAAVAQSAVDQLTAYWISCGVEVAQTALWFGADDLDGTVQEETIYHMAGSSTPTSLSTDDIEQLIRDAGREPIERDTLYNVVRVPAPVVSGFLTTVASGEGG